MHIVLIINGSKPDHVDELRQQVDRLRRDGHEVRPFLTFEAGDARRFASESAKLGADLLLVAGGDGTVNEAANGLHHWRTTAGDRPPPRLAIIPTGTANDFAHTLGFCGSIEESFDLALASPARSLNVASVNGHCFLNVSSGGAGARATQDAARGQKNFLGPLAYALSGAKHLIDWDLSHASFRSGDEKVYEGPFLLFAVGNSVRTGGGNLLTPSADPSDGLLDLCIVKELGRLEFTRLIPALRAGEHLDDPAVVYLQAREFTVEAAPGEPLAVNADGEPVAKDHSYQYRMTGIDIPVVVAADRA